MANGTGEEPPASAGKVYRSAATAIAITWSLRFIGLFSVLVLARVLTPKDFGIVALATSTMALADIFSSLGLRQALLRIARPDRAHYDTAWTIQLLVMIVLTAIVVMLGPLVAWFYQEPALTPVIAVLASSFLIYGLVNIGIVDFDRHLDLGRDYRMRIGVRLATFVVTLAAALILRNYWALVIGAVIQAIFHATASYIFHPFRPRFSLAKRAELLGVSLWMLLATAAQTLHYEIERFVVGRIGSLQTLGFYSVSKDLSSIFTQEIATALNRVTFVTTARTGRPLSADPQRLRAMLGAYAMIAAPLGLGLSATAENTTRVLLGSQWTGAVPYLQLIAPASAMYAVYKLIASSLQASGDARHAAMLSMAGTASMALGITIAVLTGGGVIEVAIAALCASVLILVTGVIAMAYKAETRAPTLLFAVARPFGAALLMLLVVRRIHLPDAGPLLELIAEAVAGGALYAIFAGLIWLFSGRPAGAERGAIDIAQMGWHRIAAQMRGDR